MRKVVLLILVLFCAACTSKSEVGDLKERISSLEAELQSQEEIISSLESELQVQEEIISNLESERNELQSKYSEIESKITQISLSGDSAFVILSLEDFEAGQEIPLDGFIMTSLPIEFVIGPYISGTDWEEVRPQVEGCRVLSDIPRGMILTSTLVDCP
jgi:predicted nuclease with TOPRIM domain